MGSVLRGLFIAVLFVLILYSLPVIGKIIKSFCKGYLDFIKIKMKNIFKERIIEFIFTVSILMLISLVCFDNLYLSIILIILLSLICFIKTKVLQIYNEKKDGKLNKLDITLKEKLESIIAKGATGKDISNLVEYMEGVAPDEIIQNLKDMGIPNLKKLKYIIKKDMENKKRVLYTIGIIFSPIFIILLDKITYNGISLNVNESIVNELKQFFKEVIKNEFNIMLLTSLCVTVFITLIIEFYSVAYQQKIKMKTEYYLEIIDEIIDEFQYKEKNKI